MLVQFPRPEFAGAQAPPCHNLPLPLTSFIGRHAELMELTARLNDVRLVTLTGPGGCGKTRLAIELATRLIGEYPDGVWFVDLTPLASPDLLTRAIGEAAGVAEQSGRPMLDTLISRLATTRTLLLLDNCEHLIGSVAPVIESLLRACPYVKVVATSREHLNVGGELRWSVPPLSLPALHPETTLETASRSEAVGLFVERAALGRPGFRLDATNVGALARICHRLDGLPLAIELAAARVHGLPPEDLLEQLSHRPRLLRGGARANPPRHQTLLSTMAWSYDLLDPGEQMLFRRMCIFAGSFSLAAAIELSGSDLPREEDTLDLLLRLVDKSMLVADSADGHARYRLLETLRQFGSDRLEEHGEAPALARRHAQYFLAYAEEAERAFGGLGREPFRGNALADQAAALRRLEQDHDNLRSALDWALDQDPELGLRLASALGQFWFLRGHLSEGLAKTREALDKWPDATPVRAKTLNMAGSLARSQNDHTMAEAFLKEGLALARELNHGPTIADALLRLGTTALHRGDPSAARAYYDESLAVYGEIGDRWGVAALGYYFGLWASSQGDLIQSRQLLEACIAPIREFNDRWHLCHALTELGRVTQELGDYAAAHTYLAEAIRESSQLGQFYALAFTLENMGALAAATNDFERALRLGAAADMVRDARGAATPKYRVSTKRWLDAAQSALSAGAARSAYLQGRALSIDQAVAYALAEVPHGFEGVGSPTGGPAQLTRREWEIAQLVADGLTNRSIADKLVISERTVEGHLEQIRRKLAFRSRAQIAAFVASRPTMAQR